MVLELKDTLKLSLTHLSYFQCNVIEDSDTVPKAPRKMGAEIALLAELFACP